MIIETPSTFVFPLLGIGHTAHISPVVITEHDDHVIRNFHSFFIIVEHFFIKGPYLWSFLSRLASHISNDLPLILHNTLHQLRICFHTHSLIAIATHANGHNIICTFHSRDSFTKETVQILLIGIIIPGTPTFSVAGILLMVACHGLMVGSTHHNAHLISSFQILRVIGIESPTPHRWPHIISFQSQNQLKYFRIEAMVTIVRSKSVLHPGCQTGGFII